MAMKVTDLMVGDWVICNHYQDKPFTKRFGVADFAKGEYEFCEPIPLTEDILAKNGFVYREAEETCATVAYHHWQLDGHSFALNYTQYFRKEKKDDMPRFDVAGIAIHYVHQLQHLLRLCGIKKELIID